jgi:hypothetical protein
MQHNIKCTAYIAAIKAHYTPDPLDWRDSMYINLLIWTLLVNFLSAKSAIKLSVYERLWPMLMFMQWVFCCGSAYYLSLHGTDSDLSHEGCAGRDMQSTQNEVRLGAALRADSVWFMSEFVSHIGLSSIVLAILLAPTGLTFALSDVKGNRATEINGDQNRLQLFAPPFSKGRSLITKEHRFLSSVVFKDQPWFHLGFFKVMLLYNPATLRGFVYLMSWSENLAFAALQTFVIVMMFYFAGASFDHTLSDLQTPIYGRLCVSPQNESNADNTGSKLFTNLSNVL